MTRENLGVICDFLEERLGVREAQQVRDLYENYKSLVATPPVYQNVPKSFNTKIISTYLKRFPFVKCIVDHDLLSQTTIITLQYMMTFNQCRITDSEIMSYRSGELVIEALEKGIIDLMVRHGRS